MINITKQEMINLLKHYRAERESIDALLVEMAKDLDIVFVPDRGGDLGVVVQRQHDYGKQIDALLRKCDVARTIQRETLLNMKQRTEVLDRLMFCLTKMPGDLRVIITDIVMADETLEDFAAKTGKSIATVKRRKEVAVDVLYAKLTKRKVEHSYANDEGEMSSNEPK